MYAINFYKSLQGEKLMQIVECLKCSNHYFEEKKFIDKCPFCGNKDKEQTIYLSEEGSIYQSIMKEKR